MPKIWRAQLGSVVESVTDVVVVIVERSSAEQKRFVYDRRSGWLRQMSLEQSSGLGVFGQYYELASVQWLTEPSRGFDAAASGRYS